MLFGVRYITDVNFPDEWKDLLSLRKELPQSRWVHNRLFEDMAFCAEKGVSPHVFWAYSREEQALLLAFFRTRGTIEAYERHLAEKEAERNRKKH